MTSPPRTAARFSVLFATLSVGLAACGMGPSEAPSETADSLVATGCTASTGFLSRSTLAGDPQVLLEDVTYCSAGLRVRAQVCRPRASGRYPILSLNHAGVLGVLDRGQLYGTCAMLARGGFATFESDYRGEAGSQGTVEVCEGETADALNLLLVANTQPYVQAGRIGMMGMSHGGCVVLHALELGFRPLAAAALYAPTDFAGAYGYWQWEIAHPGSTGGAVSPDAVSLSALLRQVTGGVPGQSAQVNAEYANRSPLSAVALLAAAPTPVFFAQGTSDIAVPYTQSCAFMARSAGSLFAFLTTTDGSRVIGGAPFGCGQTSLHWLAAGAKPSTWTQSRRWLGVYDGATHGGGPAGGAMPADAVNFLRAWIP